MASNPGSPVTRRAVASVTYTLQDEVGVETNRVKQSDVHITYEYYDTSIKGPNDRRIHTIRWVEQLPDKALTPVSPEELKVLEDPNAGIPNGS